MPGIRLPSLMIVREGNSACIAVESFDKLLYERLDKVLESLTAIAEKILQKVSLATHSERAKEVINAWDNRGSISALKKLQLVTGLDLNELKITGLAANLAEWDLSDDPLADSELAAAARFARSGKKETYDSFASDRKKILEHIKRLTSLKVFRIDDLSLEMEALLKEDWQQEPFKQGYNLALNLRKKLKIDDDEAADPEKFLKDYNIEVRDIRLSSVIDGIGCVVLSEKRQGDITVLMCRRSKIKNQKVIGDKFYVAQKGSDNAHGKTIAEATQELMFKIGPRDVSQYRNMPKDTKKTPNEWALVYRMVTGACSYGTNQFIESQGKLKRSYTLAEILERTKGQFGAERFRDVVESAQ